ncbi:hypothetical protein CPB83DRAFT_865474 [Crepidotus variabilis]|uniref:F-box domain-containing protein n=1 Tax=Crepidotus variabilis TaxID=179855 RepID=A0A9P6JHQ6_9AGAR|nr:hypothetical protein CPB83DRAFT_865474 [Crepidotus variabilis]
MPSLPAEVAHRILATNSLNRRDLLSTCLASKYLYSLAIRLLWAQHQSNIAPLIMLLGCDCGSQPSERPKCLQCSSELDSLHVHAQFMAKLHVIDSDIPLIAALLQVTARPLCPNISNLTVNARGEKLDFTPFCSLLRHSPLTHIIIRSSPHNSSQFSKAFDGILQLRRDHIQFLDMTLAHLEKPIWLDSFSALSQLKLETVNVPGISFYRMLSKCPQLDGLTLRLVDSFVEEKFLEEGLIMDLSTLTELKIFDFTEDVTVNVFSVVSFSKLLALHISLPQPPTSTALLDIFDALAQTSRMLKSLSVDVGEVIDYGEFGDGYSDEAVSYDTLSPLLALTGLEEFSLTPNIACDGFSDGQLKMLATAWPNLRHFAITGEFFRIPRPIATSASIQCFLHTCPNLQSLCYPHIASHIELSPASPHQPFPNITSIGRIYGHRHMKSLISWMSSCLPNLLILSIDSRLEGVVERDCIWGRAQLKFESDVLDGIEDEEDGEEAESG